METRIALIAVVGALAGTLAGGLLTWMVARDQFASQRSEVRREERLDAYSKYFGDAARLWTQVFNFYEVTPRPRTLSRAESAQLDHLLETLTRDYALVAMLAPNSVRSVARELNNADTDVGNALQSEPIDHPLYLSARKRATEGSNNLLLRFSEAAKKDLGTSSR
jgi:hypothetical protein